MTTPTPPKEAMAAEVARACKTPVQDLLRAIPADHRITFETDNNGFKVWHSCPIGKHAHEAADLLHRQQAEIERLKELVFDAERATARECMGLIPTSWLDPILSGPNAAVKKPPADGPAIEALCSSIAKRINERFTLEN